MINSHIFFENFNAKKTSDKMKSSYFYKKIIKMKRKKKIEEIKNY